jgi:serine/threonine protein kinase
MFSKTKNTKPTFSWKPKEWKNRRMLHADILLMHKTDSTQTVIVRKVVKQEERNGRPVKHFEIRALASLPNCNRIVPMLGYADNDPQKGWASIIYEWYPMGDLYNWKKENFDAKNFKPIPESYIWRFFIQVS